MNADLPLNRLFKSLINITERIGPNTDPCGIPLMTGIEFDKQFENQFKLHQRQDLYLGGLSNRMWLQVG